MSTAIILVQRWLRHLDADFRAGVSYPAQRHQESHRATSLSRLDGTPAMLAHAVCWAYRRLWHRQTFQPRTAGALQGPVLLFLAWQRRCGMS